MTATAAPEDAPAVTKGFIHSRDMRFPKHADIIQGKVRRLLRTNAYGAKAVDAALKIVRKHDVVLELGGGIGYMSTLVATKCEVKSVHSFEANPHLIPYIQKVHAANGVQNAHITNAILGARKGSADFYVRTPMLGSSMSMLKNEVDPPSIKVDVLNAKTVMKEIAPTVLICDIQGAEVESLPHLDLSILRTAIVEIHPQWIGAKGVNAVFNTFMDAGMTYFDRGSQGKVICFRTAW